MEKKNNRMLLLALALSMSMGIQSAQAVNVGDDLFPITRWNSLREAIMEGTDPTINFVDDIEPNVSVNNITTINSKLSELTINGQGHSLSNNYQFGSPSSITVAAEQTLNINNLNQSNFERFLYNYGTININGGSFNNNSSSNGGAIANANGIVVIENADFEGNSSSGNGGAIDTWGTGITTIIDSSFKNNHANDDFDYNNYVNGVRNETTSAGGAITNNDGGTLNIVAQNKDVEFTGNTVGSGNNEFSNAIANNGTINLNASEGHSIIFNDTIGYSLGSSIAPNTININKRDVALTNSAGEAIKTPTAGTIAINNAVYDQTVNLYGGTLKFGTSGGFDSTEGHHVNFNIYGGLLDTINGAAGYTGVGRVHGYSDVNFALDADAGLHFADHYDAYGNYVAEDGVSLNISKISIINSSDNKFVGEAVDVDNGNSTWEWVNVKDDTELVDADGNKIEGNTLVSWNKETGILKAGKYNLNNAVSDNETVSVSDGGNYNRENVAVDLNSDRIYRLVEDEIVSQTLGDMTNGSLTIAGNNHNISANGANIGGINVGDGDNLSINDVLSFGGFNSQNGGALNITGGTTSVSGTNFDKNTASQNGGAINISGGTLGIEGGTFNGNEAAAGGGAINASGGTVTAANTKLDSNIAQSGGAISASGSANVTLNNSTISNNIATNSGGGIYASGSSASVALNNTGITGNFAAEGSAIYNNGANISITNSNITDNTGNSSIYNTGILNISTSEAGKTLTIDNKKTDNTQSIISNGQTINLNAVSGSNIIVKDDISGLSAKTDENVVNVNNNTGAAGTVDIGKVSSSTVNISNGTANINGNVDSSNINAGGIQTTISGNVLNSSNVTTTAGATSITGNVTGSKVNTSGGKSTISGDITNNSTISNSGSGTTELLGSIKGSNVDVSGGTLTTAEGAGISEDSSLNISGGKADIKSSVDSSDITVSNTGDADVSGAVTNSTLTTEGGTADYTGTITNSTIETTGGTANFTNTVSDTGVIISGGQTNITSLTGDSTFAQENGTATINSIVNSTATQSGGTLNLGNTITDTIITAAGGTTNLGTTGGNIDFSGSTLTLGDGNGANGNANLVASALRGGKVTVNSGSVLNTANASTIASTVSGAGNINKTGNTTLSFSNASGASGADFTGSISASGGTVELNSNYGLNADANINLSNAILNYTTSDRTLGNDQIANINLSGNGTANVTGSGEITLADKFWTMTNSGNALNLNDAKYTLGSDFSTGGDMITFNNAEVSLAGQNYADSSITLNNSDLLLYNRIKGDNYYFDRIVSDGGNLTLDIDLAYNDGENPVADTITYGDGSSGLLNITELFITDDNGAIGSAGTEGKIIQILDGNGDLQLKPADDMEILSWATNVYEYGVNSAKTEHEADSIRVAMERPSSTDTLRDLNRYNINNTGDDINHNRGFSFIAEKDEAGEVINGGTYNIYRDLDTTAEGMFTINGRVENGIKSVLSGKLENLVVAADSERVEKREEMDFGGGMGTIGWKTVYDYKDADGNVEATVSSDKVTEDSDNFTFAVGAMGKDSGEDARGSMFELVHETNFKINNVSIEDAKRYAGDTIKDGAVIYADNDNATVALESTDFKNNSVKGGNGGAIANIQSETFSITNALFEGNSASANGGAIYNAANQTIDILAGVGGTTQFTANAATLGGAIYNAGILNMSTSGESSKIIVDAATDTASNDIYNVGTLNLNGDITINSAIKDAETASGTTNLNGGTLTLGDKATITQNNFNIADGVTFSTNADKLSIANLITNEGILTFTGGANANNIKNENSLVFDGATGNSGTISGEGSTTINKGTVNNTGTITQGSLLIASDATLKTNASSLTIANAIENSGVLDLTGGENANDITGEGITSISGGTVTNTGAITQGILSIVSGAALSTNASSLTIANAIDNLGTLTFTGGTNNNDIAGEGALNITGTVTNADDATVEQNNLSIASGAGLTTNADNLTITQAIQNAGTLTFTGGTNANDVQGAGQTVIDGEVTNNALISQSISVNEKASLTSDVSNVAGTIANEGKINLSGNSGAINKDITGKGDAEFSGSITNNASITQNHITIANGGVFSTAADKFLTENGVTNSGSLTLTGGENKNAVENAGTLTFLGGSNSGTITNNNSLIFNGEITNNGGVSGTGATTIAGGNITNNALISQAVEITGGKLTSTAENLGGTIANNSKLLLSGTLGKTIEGEGTTSINGELALVDGAHIDGTLNMNNGTLDLNDGEDSSATITEHNIGKLTGTGTIKIDADLSANAEEGDSDTLNIGSAENASINIDSINVTADHVVPSEGTDDPFDSKFVQVIDGAGKDDVNLTLGGNDGKVSTLTSDYLYEFVKHETNNGAVKVNINKTTADLADFIQGTDGTENIYTYSMTRDESTPPIIGTTNRTYIPADGLNLNLNGHTLSSGQASGDGITVADGYTLNVTGDNGTVTGFDTAFENNGTLNVSETQFENNQNALTNNAGGELDVSGSIFTGNQTALTNSGTADVSDSTFANNDTAITNNAGGNLNLSNITFDGNGVDVDNNGTLNLAGNTVIEGGITGQGTTNITSGITNAVNTIVQDKLNISSGATLDGAGNVTANVNNEGTMNYADGSVNANTITGNGILNAQGNLTNNGDVSQGTVNIVSGSTFTNSGTLEVTNTLNNTDSTIANSGELTLAGQNMQNNGTINGSGTTNISGNLQNNGTIEQDVEITQSGELTSNADNIKNNILNNGVYNITGGTIANAITGSGDLNLSSNMTLASSITGNNINLNNGILSFAQSADISSATLSANGGSINLQNDTIQNTNLGNLILNSDLNLMLDGSFADMKLDTITANSFTNNGGHSINISNILLSSPTDKTSFSISPLGSGMNDTVSTALAGAIQYTGGEIVYSPIYKYSAKYDPDMAMLNFNRVGGGGYETYNPGVFAGAVAAQLGGYLTQLNSYDEAFRNMDMYMLMTQEQRQAMKMRNKYAAASADSNIVFDPTITQYENKAGWFRPYATFEKVDLKGGPTVSNVAYGSFFGAESEMYDLGHGWDGIWGVYGGYNGSHQSYDGVGIYQNGGTLGAIGMAYKGNFFTGLTANVGANSGEASTMFGQDNFTLLMSGVASKSGYNWELAKGKFIIQPNFLISYSYVNTFNYRDAQGVGIESDPLHAIQIEPGIKLIGNLKNGWQPYASVSMVWNIMDKTQFQANYVSLPELSVKPFVKYGVGVRKSWGERFTGFFQTYFTNGGRNGVGLQLGLRFMLGKSPKKTLNGPVPELKKTVIKVGRK